MATDLEKFSADQLEGYFEQLDEWRRSCAVNMFRAYTHLSAIYGLSEADARIILYAWTLASFNHWDFPACVRVEIAFLNEDLAKELIQ